jgi:hypothetical protein
VDRRGSRAGAGDGADRDRFLILLIVLLLLAACSSNPKNDAPPIGVDLALANTPTNILYFAGPVNLQFAVTLTNPTDMPVTLRRLDLRTLGGSSFYMRATGTPFHVEVKPHANTTVTMSAWGNSRGGMLAEDEPIQLQATAYFDSPKGPFVRLLNAVVSPR